MLQKRLIIEWIVIFLFGCVLSALSISYDWTQKLDNLLIDQAVPLAAPIPSDKIIIVEFDERSLKVVGKWQWKRSIHADLITRISEANPRVIGYDVLFTEPGDAVDDRLLAEAVSNANNVVLPLQFQMPGSDGREIDELRPYTPLAEATAGLGHVSAIFDNDGLVRHVELQRSNEDQPFPHMMETVAKLYGRSKVQTGRSGKPTLLPLNAKSSFRTVPAASVLNGEVPSSFIKGKIVLVGATAQGLGDNFPVPASVGSVMPGIEMQANLLNGLLVDDFIEETSKPWSFALALSVIVLMMAAFWKLSPKANLALSLAVLALLGFGSIGIAVYLQLWVAPSAAILVVLILYPLWGWRRLAALNDFVSVETLRLAAPNGTVEPKSGMGFDAIARQALRLRSVIGELAERQDFISGVIGAAPDAICVVDSDGKVTFSNDAAKALFGERLDDPQFVNIFAPEGQVPQGAGIEWKAPNGQAMLVTVSEFSDAETGASTIFSFANVTEIRKAEYERKEMLEFLSHDMRSPQASIISLIDTPDIGGTNQVGLLPRIRKHAEKTLKLTEDFVQLARLASVEPQFDELNLVDLLQEAIDENYSLARQKSIKIVCENADRPYYIKVDGGIMLRAFSNLLSNSIKYSPEDSEVLCTIKPMPNGQKSKPKIRCIIADQGPGIPAERLENLFGRFGYRSESGVISAGLGLAFVKNAVEKNAGEISCISSATEGTSFEITFDLLR